MILLVLMISNLTTLQSSNEPFGQRYHLRTAAVIRHGSDSACVPFQGCNKLDVTWLVIRLPLRWPATSRASTVITRSPCRDPRNGLCSSAPPNDWLYLLPPDTLNLNR